MIRCGNCQGSHPTSREVRECYDPFVDLATDSSFKPAEKHQRDLEVAEADPRAAEGGPVPTIPEYPETEARETGSGPAPAIPEEKPRLQETANIIPWLRQQTWSDFAMSLVSYADRHGGLTAKQAASARSMRAKIENKQNGSDQSKLREVEGQVEAGRYAIDGVDGKIMFYKVDKPEEGRWSGRTFVKVQASDDFWPVKDPASRLRILSTIADDPEAAMMRYGQELGKCGRCGRTLTDETSRDLGIGPVCRGDQ